MLHRGNRLLTTASVLLLVIAALHTWGIVSDGGEAGELDELIRDMKRQSVDMGLGMRPTVWAMTRNPSLAMGVVLVYVALLNMIVLAIRPGDARLIGLLKLAGTGFAWILAALAAAYRLPPALLSFALVALVFTASHFERGDSKPQLADS